MLQQAEKRYTSKILMTKYLTDDVKLFVIEKPKGYTFTPGQATYISINKENFREKKSPFSFTSLNEWPYLEFMIKIYDSHNGVTHELGKLQKDDELIIRDPWGAIHYKGKGVFLAGGAGITPFVAILRELYKKNKIDGNMLIFSNKTSRDMILQDELDLMLGDYFIRVFTRENVIGFTDRRIDKTFLIDTIGHFDQNFYVCGPPGFVKNINNNLLELGAAPESLVFEK